MNTKILLWLCGVALLLGSCREEFDDHYNKVNDASIGKNVTQVSEEKGGFDLFLQMIRRADLERTLSQSGLYTCFAPKDEHVQKWLDENGWTVATMPERKLIEFINYHFMVGMSYYYNFEKVYEDTDDWDKAPIRYNYGIIKSTRTSGKAYPSKRVRIFTQSYLDIRADDYRKMENVEPGDFMVENVPVSATDRDIPTSNGVVHVLDGPLMLMPRMDEAIAADPELSIISKWFDRFSGYATIGEENDKIDTTLMKYYDVAVKPSTSGKTMNIASEDLLTTALLPTDAAMQEYFKPYLTPDLLGSFDSIPNELVVPFLQSLVFDYSYVWGISDIERNNPYFYSYGTQAALISMKNDIPAMFKESVNSSNCMIYKLNQVPEIPLLTSVAGGYYIRHKHYKEWAKLFDRLGNKINVDNFFGISNSYQHQARIVLIQPDNSKAWDNGDKEWGLDGYNADYMDTLAYRISSGILIGELENNHFERRFYPTGTQAYVLADKENGETVFSDYTGKKIHLLAQEPVWTADNGAMFEVDGIFSHLLATDTTELLYRKYIAKEENLSSFRDLVDKAELAELLDETSSNYYTIFAPSNEALKSYNINAIEKEDAQKMVRKCIVSGRKIFTDGTVQGNITMLDGSRRTLSDAWENTIFGSQYGSARFILEESNRQGSNGVLHVVDKFLQN